MSDVPQYLIDIGASKIAKAQAAFAALVQQISGQNLIEQITLAGKTKLIADAVRPVVYYGTTGSLWEAYAAAQSIVITPEMSPFLTEEKRQQFKNKLVEIISGL